MGRPVLSSECEPAEPSTCQFEWCTTSDCPNRTRATNHIPHDPPPRPPSATSSSASTELVESPEEMLWEDPSNDSPNPLFDSLFVTASSTMETATALRQAASRIQRRALEIEVNVTGPPHLLTTSRANLMEANEAIDAAYQRLMRLRAALHRMDPSFPPPVPLPHHPSSIAPSHSSILLAGNDTPHATQNQTTPRNEPPRDHNTPDLGILDPPDTPVPPRAQLVPVTARAPELTPQNQDGSQPRVSLPRGRLSFPVAPMTNPFVEWPRLRRLDASRLDDSSTVLGHRVESRIGRTTPPATTSLTEHQSQLAAAISASIQQRRQSRIQEILANAGSQPQQPPPDAGLESHSRRRRIVSTVTPEPLDPHPRPMLGPRSYHVRRRLNADGEEHVTTIDLRGRDLSSPSSISTHRTGQVPPPAAAPERLSWLRDRRERLALSTELVDRPSRSRSRSPVSASSLLGPPPETVPLAATSQPSEPESEPRRRGWARIDANGDEICSDDEQEPDPAADANDIRQSNARPTLDLSQFSIVPPPPAPSLSEMSHRMRMHYLVSTIPPTIDNHPPQVFDISQAPYLPETAPVPRDPQPTRRRPTAIRRVISDTPIAPHLIAPQPESLFQADQSFHVNPLPQPVTSTRTNHRVPDAGRDGRNVRALHRTGELIGR